MVCFGGGGGLFAGCDGMAGEKRMVERDAGGVECGQETDALLVAC